MEEKFVDKDLKEAYLNAGVDCAVSPLSLNPLPLLPVLDGMRCHLCFYCAISVDTMRKHLASVHNLCGNPDDAGTAKVADFSFMRIKVQSVFGGNKRRYFEVSATNGGTELGRGPMRFLSSFRENIEASINFSESRMMNAFLATTRFDSYLLENGIQMEAAWSMTRLTTPEQEPTFSKVRYSTGLYFKTAFQNYKRSPIISSRMVQGVRLRIELEPSTLEKYECVARRMIIFACALETKTPGVVSRSICDAVRCIIDSQDDDSANIRHLHEFMRLALFDVIEARGGDMGFVALFIARMSVVGGPSKECLRFGETHDISPTLAALKYCVRLISVLEVSGYGATTCSPDSWK
jgi:hypothetical protein